MPKAPKLTRNPNAGKRTHASRASVNVQPIRWSEVETRYMPGKTIAARIAGIQAHYDRAAQVSSLG